MTTNSSYNVLIIIDALRTGGAEQITVQTANLLVRQNHNVMLCTILPWEETPLSKQLNPRVIKTSVNRKCKWNPVYMYNLRSFMMKYDIIHVHSSHNLRYTQLVNVIFRMNRTIVYHEHSGKAVNNILPCFMNKLFFKNIIYLANNLTLLKHVQEKWMLNSLKTTYIPNPVRTPNPTNTQKYNENFTIGMIGNFLPVKNYEFAIELFNYLNIPKSKLLIVGNAYDKAYFEKIEHLTYSSKQLVQIITDCSDSYKIIPDFDIAWHTSNSESGPLVLGEYMAHHIPFLCYRTGEVADKVKSIHPELVLSNFVLEKWGKSFYQLNEKTIKYGTSLFELYQNEYSEELYFERCIKAYQQSLSY